MRRCAKSARTRRDPLREVRLNALLRPLRRPRRRRTLDPLEQLALDLGPERARWRFSRLVVGSPHAPRIRERLEFVRAFFPELDGLTIRVGLVKARGVLGWGSLDPEQPGIWVRPRRLETFTIAHEFTHLLQARGLVPRGERSCDLFALTRSPLLVDHAPGYLRLPFALRHQRPLEAASAIRLTTLAREAVAARAAGDRRYLLRFEQAVANEFGNGAPRVRRSPRSRALATALAAGPSLLDLAMAQARRLVTRVSGARRPS